MAWIEFHATRIVKLRKFHDLRREMGWSTSECLGNLGLFWGQTLEVCEQGEVTGWKGEYLSSLMGFGAQVSEKMLKALGTHGWLDFRNDRVFIHDWIDYVGTYLRSKYAGDNRDKLISIWALHGRIYRKPIGNQLETNWKPIGNQLETNCTLPNHTLPNHITTTPLPPKGYDPPDKSGEYKAVTPLQKAICGWKVTIGVQKDDREWDTLNWKKTCRVVKELVEFFKGDLKATIDCMQGVYDYFTNKGLSCTIHTVKSYAYQWRKNGGKLDANARS